MTNISEVMNFIGTVCHRGFFLVTCRVNNAVKEIQNLLNCIFTNCMFYNKQIYCDAVPSQVFLFMFLIVICCEAISDVAT